MSASRTTFPDWAHPKGIILRLNWLGNADETRLKLQQLTGANMKRRNVTHVLFLAALTAGTTLAISSARAQFQVNQGNVLDASNRFGSYGYNNNSSPYGIGNNNALSGNQIVTGNATNGREVRG